MTKKEIKEMSDTRLIAEFHNINLTMDREINSSRGTITKQTENNLKWLIDELSLRFEIDKEQLLIMID